MRRPGDYVLPDDVTISLPTCLRHRLALSYEALADGVDADSLVGHIIDATAPRGSRPVRTRRVRPSRTAQIRDPPAGPVEIAGGAASDRHLRELELVVLRRLDGMCRRLSRAALGTGFEFR